MGKDKDNRPKRRGRNLVINLLFYGALIAALVVVFAFFSGGTGAPRSFFGYSAMTVLSSSMQDEIPMNSMIITHEVEPSSLEVGDDITFLRDANTTVTHRITAIYENYLNTGYYGFQTKGIMNATPDNETVISENVVGKVIFDSLILGQIIIFIRSYGVWILAFALLGIGFIIAMRVVLSKPKNVQSALANTDRALPTATEQAICASASEGAPSGFKQANTMDKERAVTQSSVPQKLQIVVPALPFLSVPTAPTTATPPAVSPPTTSSLQAQPLTPVDRHAPEQSPVTRDDGKLTPVDRHVPGLCPVTRDDRKPTTPSLRAEQSVARQSTFTTRVTSRDLAHVTTPDIIYAQTITHGSPLITEPLSTASSLPRPPEPYGLQLPEPPMPTTTMPTAVTPGLKPIPINTMPINTIPITTMPLTALVAEVQR